MNRRLVSSFVSRVPSVTQVLYDEFRKVVEVDLAVTTPATTHRVTHLREISEMLSASTPPIVISATIEFLGQDVARENLRKHEYNRAFSHAGVKNIANLNYGLQAAAKNPNRFYRASDQQCTQPLLERYDLRPDRGGHQRGC